MEIISVVLAAMKRIGVGWTWSLTWTGDNEMKDNLSLLDLIHIAFSRPEYQPGGGLTHCNSFVSEVVTGYGFKGLDGLLANDIIDLISVHPDWSIITLEKAQDACNTGTLIIAGLKANPHGHVCLICPGKPKISGRWGNVPSVANVGEKNFIGSGINWSFSDLPTLWAWRSSL
jgi:hypothetical protein